MRRLTLAAIAAAAFAGFAYAADPAPPASPAATPSGTTSPATAIFATGCFWCTESDYEKVPGVLAARSGYIGGTVPEPTYRQVAGGGTGHAEAVEVSFDPAQVTYDKLLEVFWRTTDPVDPGGQFCDRGDQYRSAIFPKDDDQRRLAEKSLAELQASGELDRPIATRIEPAAPFHPAEDYHQDYYKKNSVQYRFYRWNCGRDQRLAELWGGEMPTQ